MNLNRKFTQVSTEALDDSLHETIAIIQGEKKN